MATTHLRAVVIQVSLAVKFDHSTVIGSASICSKCAVKSLSTFMPPCALTFSMAASRACSVSKTMMAKPLVLMERSKSPISGFAPSSAASKFTPVYACRTLFSRLWSQPASSSEPILVILMLRMRGSWLISFSRASVISSQWSCISQRATTPTTGSPVSFLKRSRSSSSTLRLPLIGGNPEARATKSFMEVVVVSKRSIYLIWRAL
mmetsp:Transcript_26076/g.77720  ORF Transcript_26076/g.77720 Transcript_26076/m.77720 type:complete len:206 (-) Transcript_26076:816-1433(-)